MMVCDTQARSILARAATLERNAPMKAHTTAAALILAMLAASACGRPAGRYQMQTESGVAYVLDTHTGEVWFCRPSGCQLVPRNERRSSP